MNMITETGDRIPIADDSYVVVKNMSGGEHFLFISKETDTVITVSRDVYKRME